MLGFVTCMLGNVSTLGLGLRRSARAATVVAGTLFGCGSADGARGQPSSGGAAGGGNTAGMPGGGAAGTGGGGNTSGSGGSGALAPEWSGVIGTGQSLAVGTTPVTSTSQPYNNLKLSLGGAVVPPWDPNLETLSLVPLVEPIRPMGSGFPRPYPGNLWGETPHSAMANQITSLVKAADPSADYVTVHTVVGESGEGMVSLKKQTGDTTGTKGRAYAATLFEVAAITRLAQAAGQGYAVRAVVMTHGETDSGSAAYESELIQLLADYNTDLAAITGQAIAFPMLMSQQFAYPSGAGQRPVANQLQWRLGVDRPGEFVCTGPKYQYPGNGDGVHLSAAGYQQLGEKTGQVYHERIVLGRDWQPLQPTTVERSGRVVTVHFHVPVPPLVWDQTLSDPVAWASGRGFELRAGSAKVEISSVEIVGDAVAVTASTDPPAGALTVGYAMTSGGTQMAGASRAYRWGQLRDSDPFVGSTTNTPQPNYAVSFEMPVP